MRAFVCISVLLGVCGWLALAAGARADALDQWHWRNPLPQGNPFSAVCYGNGLFVAIGPNGTLLTSTNGTAWVRRRISGSFSDITFGGGLFVAVGATIMTSTNGIDWVHRFDAEGFGLFHIAYGNGLFVGTGFYDTVTTSADGVTWTPRALGICCNLILNIFDIAFGAGRFVIIGYPNTIATSTDGITWTNLDTYPWANAVVYANGRFVMMGDSGTTATSSDGLAWTSPNLASPFSLHGLTYANGLFIAVGYETATYEPVVVNSTDAVHWSRRNATTISRVGDIICTNNLFVAVGETLLTSSNAVAWTNWMQGFRAPLRSITAGPGGFVAVGDTTNGGIFTSTDGVGWTAANPDRPQSLTRIVRGGGQYAAVGYGGAILTSADGRTWTNRFSGTTNQLFGVAYGNSCFVAVGWEEGGRSPRGTRIGIGTVLTSADGAGWEDRSAALWNTNCELEAVTYGNGLFVGVGAVYLDFFGYRRLAVASTNGQAWWDTRLAGAGRLRGATYAHGTFVAVGNDGAILTSLDGTNWTDYVLGPGNSSDLLEVTWGGGLFAALLGSSILTSTDGAVWIPHNTGSAYQLNGIAYQDGVFVTVGDFGTILQSDNVLVSLSGRPLADRGGFELGMSGGAERRHRLQATSDLLAPDWTDLVTFTNTAPVTTFLETAATNFDHRFYRVVSP